MTKKTLLIGCGFLGSHIFSHLKELEREVVATNFKKISSQIRKLDITDLDSVAKCVSFVNPDLVINCAANVQIDYLEKNQELAFSINAYGAENVAKACEGRGIRLIHISSDAVFDGKRELYQEEDNPNPVNVYGKSKLLGENLIQKLSKNYVIIRTNMYGYNPDGRFLFNWILNSLRENKEIVGFHDVIFNPIEISNLSKLIIKVGDTSFNGILHLGSDDVINKLQFALQIAEVFKLNKNLVKKGSINDVK